MSTAMTLDELIARLSTPHLALGDARVFTARDSHLSPVLDVYADEHPVVDGVSLEGSVVVIVVGEDV